MRTVTLDITRLGLAVGDVIKIQLVDSVGNIHSHNGWTINEDITLDSETFSKELYENEDMHFNSTYKITLENSLKFYFTLPKNIDNTQHELSSLLKIGCVAGIINSDNNSLDSDFIKKLDIYFTGGNPHFTQAQEDLVSLYKYYADEVIDTNTTIDIVQIMDEYLAKIGV